jgi:methanogenic corrinoid protein MtbC1
MIDLLTKLSDCIEKGKSEKESPYPPKLKGSDGAKELTEIAIRKAIPPDVILREGLISGMNRIGEKFGRGEAFIPDLLMSARAMHLALEVLKPYFNSGEILHRGTIILGTVAGDLHEIGKNLVRMVVEGNGWKVIDLGVDASVESFLQTLQQNPGAILGMSALLTTTMSTMADSVRQIKALHPETLIYVGGAPVTQQFCDHIGADGYFPDPHSFVLHLDEVV